MRSPAEIQKEFYKKNKKKVMGWVNRYRKNRPECATLYRAKSRCRNPNNAPRKSKDDQMIRQQTWKLLDQVELQYNELETKIAQKRATHRDYAIHNVIVWLMNLGGSR